MTYGEIAQLQKAQAGLASGDLITHVNGDAIGSIQVFLTKMRGRAADTRVTFLIERDGILIEFSVRLGTRPPPEARPVARFGRIDDTARLPIDETTGARPRRLGVVVVPINEDVRRRLHLPDHRGAVVTAVAKGSPADRAKVPVGAAIVAVDNEPVDGPRDLLRLITTADSGKSVLLAYLVGARLYECEVMLADVADISTDIVSPDLSPSGAAPPPPSPETEALKRRVRELEEIIRRLER